nr:transposon Pol polyprotein [Lupinus angustifolius]
MTSRSFLGEGSNINCPPSFVGECYNFWKIRMRIFIESQDLDIWNVIEEGPYIPFTVVNNIREIKPKSSWNNEDKKKVQYDLKAKNILTSALGIDEFFRVSNCKSAKEMWDTLETTHEGTEEVKRSRLNTLSQEYEMFRTKPGEKILDLQKRFTHLTNHLIALGKVLSNSDLNLKVLRSLTRTWQPKVTAISEKKSLSKMYLAALFGKLQEHELELSQLDPHEEQEKKKKNISLKEKVDRHESSGDESEKDDMEDISLFVKKFSKFLKRNKDAKTSLTRKFTKNNDASTSNQNFTCFECGKPGHMKMDCSNLKKSSFKGKNDTKTERRVYIAWEDNDTCSASEIENEEQAHL